MSLEKFLRTYAGEDWPLLRPVLLHFEYSPWHTCPTTAPTSFAVSGGCLCCLVCCCCPCYIGTACVCVKSAATLRVQRLLLVVASGVEGVCCSLQTRETTRFLKRVSERDHTSTHCCVSVSVCTAAVSCTTMIRTRINKMIVVLTAEMWHFALCHLDHASLMLFVDSYLYVGNAHTCTTGGGAAAKGELQTNTGYLLLFLLPF